ncbi:MAG TPA: hypothetical protein ENN19_00410 [Chloroflexi bacterium]|nr:hypothetical protein [Chloroflexota bacterium]
MARAIGAWAIDWVGTETDTSAAARIVIRWAQGEQLPENLVSNAMREFCIFSIDRGEIWIGRYIRLKFLRKSCQTVNFFE